MSTVTRCRGPGVVSLPRRGIGNVVVAEYEPPRGMTDMPRHPASTATEDNRRPRFNVLSAPSIPEGDECLTLLSTLR